MPPVPVSAGSDLASLGVATTAGLSGPFTKSAAMHYHLQFVTVSHQCPVQRGAGGLISARWCFDHKRGAVARLPQKLTEADADRRGLLLYQDGPLEIYYSPVDTVNRAAKVVIVGITPGRHQSFLALQEAGRCIVQEADTHKILIRAKNTAAFEGTMRDNLICMLDGIGLAKALKLKTTSELWGRSARCLNSTSAVIFPVFVNGDDYHGSRPPIRNSPILSAFVSQVLPATLDMTPKALVVPLGITVEGCLDSLIDAGLLDPDRCLMGFPHPSGAIGHRVATYRRNRVALARQVRQWFAKSR